MPEEDGGVTVEDAVGQGGFGDDLGGPSVQDGGPNGESAASVDSFDPSTVQDWASVDINTVPEQFHGMVNTARNLKAGFDRQVHQTNQRYDGTIQELRNQISQLQTHVTTRPNTPAQPETPLGENQWKYDLLTKMGIQEEKDLQYGNQHITLAESVFKHLAEQNGYVPKAQFEEALTRLQNLENGFVQTTQMSAKEKLTSEITQLQNIVGEGQVREYATELAALYGKPNPKGGTYTITSAYERLTGKPLQATMSTKFPALNPNAAAPNGMGNGNPVAKAKGGPLAPGDALKEMQALLDAGV